MIELIVVGGFAALIVAYLWGLGAQFDESDARALLRHNVDAAPAGGWNGSTKAAFVFIIIGVVMLVFSLGAAGGR